MLKGTDEEIKKMRKLETCKMGKENDLEKQNYKKQQKLSNLYEVKKAVTEI